jgi:hypothetical protein
MTWLAYPGRRYALPWAVLLRAFQADGVLFWAVKAIGAMAPGSFRPMMDCSGSFRPVQRWSLINRIANQDIEQDLKTFAAAD